ncbi:hypothetical protein BKM21_24325 [Pseudomonas syringae pv. syringae]|nr:hypothetical protein BKM21_24325 [Pseudomonas syringae pv. syringae]
MYSVNVLYKVNATKFYRLVGSLDILAVQLIDGRRAIFIFALVVYPEGAKRIFRYLFELIGA